MQWKLLLEIQDPKSSGKIAEKYISSNSYLP